MDVEVTQKHGMQYITTLVGIFYNHNLSYMEKFLFSVIHNLAHDPEKGCWASNSYLAKMFNVAAQSISRSIAKLKKEKLIIVKYFDIKQGGTFIRKERHIFIPDHILQHIKKYADAYYNDFLADNPVTIEESEHNKSKHNKSKHNKSKHNKITNLKKPVKSITNDTTLTIQLTPHCSDVNATRSEMLNNNTSDKNQVGEETFPKGKVEACASANPPISETVGAGASTQAFKRIFEKEKITPAIQEVTSPEKQDVGLWKINQTPDTWRSCALEIMKFWDDLKLSPSHQYAERNIQDLVKLMKGNLFNNRDGLEKYYNRPFEKDEIILAITRLNMSVTDENYWPPDSNAKLELKSKPLFKWLFDEAPKKDKKSRSSFVKYFNRPPKLWKLQAKEAPNPYPALTEAIKNEYSKQILNSHKPIVPWDMNTENKFREASSKLQLFIDNTNGNINDYVKSDLQKPEFAASVLVKSVIHSLDEYDDISRITPGWLRTDMTINDRLPKYIQSKYPYVRPITNFGFSRQHLGA